MENEIERAVRRVIEVMMENPGEQFTIDDLARVAMFSKFHFSRIFRRTTGIPPGQFLSAIRLQEAKRLLLATDASVAEICNEVGYSAVGTFSTRFKHCVGAAPTEYRRNGGAAPEAEEGTGEATVHGEIIAPGDGPPDLVCVGLFPDPIPEGRPARATVVRSPGPFTLERVPPGSWHLTAHSLTRPDRRRTGERGRRPVSLGRAALRIAPGARVHRVDVPLRPKRLFDPPVLPAVFDERPAEPLMR